MQAGVGEIAPAEGDAAEARSLSSAADYFGPVIHLTLSRAAVARALGDIDGAYDALASLSPRAMEEDRYRLFHVWWLPVLADLQLATGRLDPAEKTLEALAHAPATGAWIPVTRAWLGGRLAEARGDKARARGLYERGLEVKPVGGEPLWTRGQLLESYSGLLVATGELARGVRALKRTAQVYATVGARPALERVQQRIEALDVPAPAPWARELSSREHEIAAMVGRGFTNPEVAAELAISPKTVEYHLAKIYAKLGVPNRRGLRDLVAGGPGSWSDS
ncbi:LuxR C-terminal-related transcriptional regulator [Agromyces protaetiae]